ncbi:magnesium/cobalt transporter CorA [Garciella nitratireducens]|uniref:Magnesium transport protein CorA n=1 Tax=Garciella nitratireducens DSM 15102 TaxID=1121911 RepID=A0A1T4L061_9FIRM|nr:magnesium/cobalt transporter CorA [Garciella nitratireducens]SJZ48076.1 magnesium transporter [Garciella nitratireducens DSM 15102]
MIEIIGFDSKKTIIENLELEDLKNKDIQYFWIDFNAPSEKEMALLKNYFHFHHLTIEDCMYSFQRPKVDFYEDYYFFIFHAISQSKVEEIDVYLGENYIVTFHHKKDLEEILSVRKELTRGFIPWEKMNIYIAYLILDKIVDQYFPLLYEIEDQLDFFDHISYSHFSQNSIDKLYMIRAKLLKIRRTITSMADLLYRMINSNHIKTLLGNEEYFKDIYDHLLKLTELIETQREITAEIQSNYMSLQSNRMNAIMTMLTIITAIFIPLSFITGIYGMNFVNMPELKWKYGYFMILGVMFVLGAGMYIWFKKKGWFNLFK